MTGKVARVTRPNGTTKWIAILVSAIVAAVSITYATATDSVDAVNDSVTVVVADLDKTVDRVNQLERDSTEVATILRFVLLQLEEMNDKIDKALEN
jgi:hypothetical protein